MSTCRLAVSPGAGVIVNCLLLLLLLLLLSQTTNAGLEKTCYRDAQMVISPKGFCGANLANMIDLVCRSQGTLSNIQRGKRTDKDISYKDNDYTDTDNVFPSIDLSNESTMETLKRRSAYLTQGDDIDDTSIFIGKQAARAMFKRDSSANMWRRPRGVVEQGIVCECCWNACSMKEMQQYCHTTSTTRAARASRSTPSISRSVSSASRSTSPAPLMNLTKVTKKPRKTKAKDKGKKVTKMPQQKNSTVLPKKSSLRPKKLLQTTTLPMIAPIP